ncbi:hypothetical protein FF1_021660 [Malus domestica]
MALEDDDWDLSAEEFDSLERDAFQKLAQQRVNSASTCSSSSSSYPSYDHRQVHQSFLATNNYNSDCSFQSSPAKPVSNSLPNKVAPLSTGTRVLPPSVPCKVNLEYERLKELPKITVKFFLHASGNIAAKFPYDQAVVGAVRKIPKATWYAKERLWMFPIPSLSSAEKVLHETSSVNVEIENLDPLVHRAIAAASVVPDLRDQYDRIPSCIESKLLPFQREGVRFILQHGGRALLADEMGLGKTLQARNSSCAIAVASCVRDSWPVLIITPSSLRLQWASMIQQWMDIPSSDILVCYSLFLSKYSGHFFLFSLNIEHNSAYVLHGRSQARIKEEGEGVR